MSYVDTSANAVLIAILDGIIESMNSRDREGRLLTEAELYGLNCGCNIIISEMTHDQKIAYFGQLLPCVDWLNTQEIPGMENAISSLIRIITTLPSKTIQDEEK